MIKVLAQMKNLRRGHDTQGTLKKINIDQTYEGYANFMAPDRMEKIRSAVEKADSQVGNRIFDEGILKPRTETYLTPEWDEMIPFPTSTSLPFLSFPPSHSHPRSPRLSLTTRLSLQTAWKVRFNGYGPSDYDYESLVKRRIPDNPLYQPRGASHYGGVFADAVGGCIDMTKETGEKEKWESSEEALKPAVGVRLVKGCGMPGP